jgi:predicted transcriptional regulator
LRKEVQDSFENVKGDIGKVGDWIKDIDVKSGSYETDIETLRSDIISLREAIDEMNSNISFVSPAINAQVKGLSQTPAKTQTNNLPVQTSVQTAVQTGNLEQLTMMERAIVYVFLNNEDKLSYEDISMILGKDKSTIRGQINNIKQKNPGLIEELRELNGKKRLYISVVNKKEMVKSVKVRVKKEKNPSKKVEM